MVSLMNQQVMSSFFGIPVLGQGNKLNATGVAYANTNSREDLSTLVASVDNRIEGGLLAFSKANA